ncbi:MAG: DNA repair protein RadA [Endomicrobium sp.]|jgi:DNA repair protein RadA/Sms|nr:DNA repair protein RadA [Endomicrobium sp.]
MIKQKTIFLCQRCNHEFIQWFGRCPECESWNSFIEEKKVSKIKLDFVPSKVFKLNEISYKNFPRYKTKIKEFDNMLGGGIVPGSLTLLGGAPGIGKSTLMLHISDALGETNVVLYVSGEESPLQIKSRAERLKIKKDNIYLASETNLKNIVNIVEQIKPKFLIIDSIQTTYNPELIGGPGTIRQVKDVAMELLKVSKLKNISVFLLGHVTKDGNLAGPRILEHIVDTVLYFENESKHMYRVLRSYKNRFGPTSEIGIFKIDHSGIHEVLNPSFIFLEERVVNVAGNIVTVAMEGTRPILLEIQALVSKTAFGLPRRMVSGYDINRIIILIAVLEKKLKLPLEVRDIFVNIAGGVRVKETSADLAIACAILSANTGLIYPKDIIVFGEIGLSGEIRSVLFATERLLEAEKLGFKKALIPKGNIKNLSYKGSMEIFETCNFEKAIVILKKLSYKKTN